MLSVLAPSERFRFAGRVVAGGVTLERLQASDPATMPDLCPLTGTAAGKHVTALAVLVDSRGVVHQVNISLRGPTLTAAAGPGEAATRRGSGGGGGARAICRGRVHERHGDLSHISVIMANPVAGTGGFGVHARGRAGNLDVHMGDMGLIRPGKDGDAS